MSPDCGFHNRLKGLKFVEYKEGHSFFKNKKNKDVEIFWMDLRPGQPCPMCGSLIP